MEDTGQQRIDSFPPDPEVSPEEEAEQERAARGGRHSGTFDAAAGSDFGDFVVERRLRSGGFAEVLKAHRRSDPERPLALKRLLPDAATAGERAAMFADEAQLAMRLHHPNIVEAIEHGEAGGVPYLALEYVDGPSLGELLRACRASGERVPVPVACHVARQVLLALGYAHELPGDEGSLSLVHRDVTPDNILLGRDGAVKLGDFGLARSNERSASTQSGIIKGTVAYLSPEQASAQPVDERSDLWGLGVVLYEMLSGQRLFGDEEAAATLERIRKAEIPPLAEVDPDLPAELSALVQHALAREPADRFESAAAMERELSRYQQDAGHAAGEAELGELLGQLVERLAPSSADSQGGLDAFEDVTPVSQISALTQSEVEDAAVDDVQTVDESELEPVDPAATTDRVAAITEPTTAADDAGGPEAERDDSMLTEVVPELDQDEPEADEPTLVRAMPVPWLKDNQPSVAAEVEARNSWSGNPSPFPAGRARDDETLRSVSRPPAEAGGPALLRRAADRLAHASPRLVMLLALAAAVIGAVAILSWPSNEPAVIQLSTSPPDANVLLDGTVVSTASPHILSSVEPHEQHVLAVQKQGYRGWHTVLRLTPGQVLTMPEVKLFPVAATVAEQSPAQ